MERQEERDPKLLTPKS